VHFEHFERAGCAGIACLWRLELVLNFQVCDCHPVLS